MKNVFSFILICFITLVVIYGKLSDVNFGRNGNYGVIDWDNFGYYLYLPATFIHHDVTLKDKEWAIEAQKTYSLSSNFYQAHQVSNGKSVIQYTAGMALFYSPAFFVGHLIAMASNHPADGFSAPYQYSILIESFLLVFLGLFFLRKLCLTFFNDKISTTIIIILCLGTNFLQLYSVNTSSPHVYLFFIYSLLLYLTYRWHFNPSVKNTFLIGLFSAIMILSRPNEILFLIIPILWKAGNFTSVKEKFQFFLSNKKHLFALLIPLFFIGIIQPIYWLMTKGVILYDSYRNENFKLIDPYLVEFLFSYKKGWLLYTPIMIIGLLSFIPAIIKNRKIVLPIFIFTLVNIWILSAWDCWWYADSFSQRSILQSYPVFALPFGYFIMWLSQKNWLLKLGIGSVIVVLIGLNLYQTVQFQQGILHSSRMTKEYYWNSFLTMDWGKLNRNLLEYDRSQPFPEELSTMKSKILYYEDYSNQTNNSEIGSYLLTPTEHRSKKIRISFKDFCDTSYCFVKAKIRFRSLEPRKAKTVGLEFDMTDSDNSHGYNYRIFSANELTDYQVGEWNTLELKTVTPFLRDRQDSIQFNAIVLGDSPIEIAAFSIESYDPSNESPLKSLNFFNDNHLITKGSWTTAGKLIGANQVEKVDSISEYSSTFSISFEKIKSFRSLSYEIKNKLADSLVNASAVFSISKDGETFHYKSIQFEKTSFDWHVQTFNFEIPTEIPDSAEVKLYIWNPSSSPIEIEYQNLIIN